MQLEAKQASYARIEQKNSFRILPAAITLELLKLEISPSVEKEHFKNPIWAF